MELPAEISAFRFYSIGRVANNKVRGDYLIEAVPVEVTIGLDGEITEHKQGMKASTKASETSDAFDKDIDTTASIPAYWLPWGNTNRITAPDVRRGEYVILMKYADAQTIYWIEFKAANILRRLETVTMIWSNERQENVPLTENNVYSFTVSTHDKHITLNTTKSDGEPFAYTLQLNTKDGHFVLQDDDGNYIFLDSKNRRIRFENKDKTFIDLNRREIIGEALDLIHWKTRRFVLDASESITTNTQTHVVQASSSYSLKTTTYGATAVTFTYNGNTIFNGNTLTNGNGHITGNSYEGSSSGPNNSR